ncbi:hypothetical protein AAMO2058_000520600 [Amorphochlora amoebiformis]
MEDDGPPPLDDLSEQVEALKAHRSGKGGRISAGKCFDSKSETVEEKELKRRMMGEALLKAGRLDPGEKVRIFGLESTSGKKLNGQIVKITSFNGEADRYVVALKSGKKVRVRPSNLRILADETIENQFDSIQAGFLEKKSLTSKKIEKKTPDSDALPFVTKSDGDATLRIPEVQTTMKKSSWVTPELLQRLGKNKTLAKGMTDPELTRAIQEFSSNPKGAMAKYAHNKKVMDFLQEFIKETASFNDALKNTNKGKKPSTQTKAKKKAPSTNPKTIAPMTRPIDQGDSMQFSTGDGKLRNVSKETLGEWMSNPYIRRALEKPQTSAMIQHLRADPSAFSRYQNNPDLQILIRAGILMPPRA